MRANVAADYRGPFTHTERLHILKADGQVVRHPLHRGNQLGGHQELADGRLGCDPLERAFRFAKSRNNTSESITADVDGPLIPLRRFIPT